MNKSWAKTLIGVALVALASAVAWRWLGSTQGVAVVNAATVDVYKNPQCGCCGLWVSHLRAHGFEVHVHDVTDTAANRATFGVPIALGSCHTATVDGYVIEGHVPAVDIRRLMQQRPDVAGLAVPGMPPGSPSMESSTPQAFQTLAFTAAGSFQTFADHPVLKP